MRLPQILGTFTCDTCVLTAWMAKCQTDISHCLGRIYGDLCTDLFLHATQDKCRVTPGLTRVWLRVFAIVAVVLKPLNLNYNRLGLGIEHL